jgi:Lsr2
MAKTTQVHLIDDLDGSQASDTVSFSLDGRGYTLDLSEKNAAKLRDALAPVVASARRNGGRRDSSGSPKMTQRPTTDRERTTAIREWAHEHGHKVADRGRIPSSVVEAYEKAAG